MVINFRFDIDVQGSMVAETRILAMTAILSTQELTDDKKRSDVKLAASSCDLIFTI